MKKYNILFLAFIALSGFLMSCQDEHELGAELQVSDLKYSVTQEPGYDNKVYLTNETSGVIPYWDYVVGISNQSNVTVVYPFAGEYWIKFTGMGRAGSVTDSVKVTVSQNDESVFSAPEWALLTNGATGKTWELDMSAPIGWAGLGYPSGTADNWNWFPTYSDASWSMTNKDWGHMTFDLDGNYNVSVTQTALSGSDQTTKTGTFALDLTNGRIKFNGAEMLYGGDYHPDVANWTDVKLLELTESSLRLMVIRNQSRTGEGVCFIMFHFKPKV